MMPWCRASKVRDIVRVHIEGEINQAAQSGEDAIKAIEDAGYGPLEVRVNSFGGHGDAALAVARYIHSRGARTIVESVAASAASIIALFGRPRDIMPDARTMIHFSRLTICGDYRALRRASDHLEADNSEMINLYVARTGRTREEIAKWCEEERWFNAQEAVDYGLADRIISAPPLPDSLTIATANADATKAQTPDELLFHEVLRGFGQLKVRSLPIFKRELGVWLSGVRETNQ